MEEANAFKTWFQPGPRPVQDAFNRGGFMNQDVTLWEMQDFGHQY